MSATVASNGDGGAYARCWECRWRGGVYEGPLRSIDAQDDADDHDRQNHAEQAIAS